MRIIVNLPDPRPVWKWIKRLITNGKTKILRIVAKPTILQKPRTISEALTMLEGFGPEAKEKIARKLNEEAQKDRTARLPIGFTPPIKTNQIRHAGGRATLHALRLLIIGLIFISGCENPTLDTSDYIYPPTQADDLIYSY